ncbi:MAG: hypothetical protein U0941_04815 [Planctomycetaceae bacterium]
MASTTMMMVFSTAVLAGENDVVPKPGEFPAGDAGVYLAGELVSVDHVNRRGAIRLVGDNNDDRYHSAPSHRFALLPYAQVRYHGAPAELRDIPIGTVLHGTFLLPADGITNFPPADKRPSRYVPRQSQVLTLEDDFSFYERQGQAWKIQVVDPGKGTLKVTSNGKTVKQGLSGEQVFEVDASTRVWKGRGLVELKELAAGQEVQVNLTWAPEWKNAVYHVADVFIDPESREVSREVQRQIHIRQQRTRWLPGWVDHVEHQPGGGGVVTVTLFGGMDPTLYEAARAQAKPGGGASLAAAEWTLRTWWQEHDSKNGPVLDFKEMPSPPLGSSGLQLRLQFHRLLEGYRPGRIVRLRPNGFPNVKLPPEERINSIDER